MHIAMAARVSFWGSLGSDDVSAALNEKIERSSPMVIASYLLSMFM